MSAIVFLLIALVVACVGSVVAYLRQREPVAAGIAEFRRDMQAVAPHSRGRGQFPSGKP